MLCFILYNIKCYKINPMDRNELQRLAKKYFNDTATPAEKELLTRWYDAINDNDQLEIVDIEASETEADIKRRIYHNILYKINLENGVSKKTEKSSFVRKITPFITAAAAVVLIVSGGLFYFNKKGVNGVTPVAQTVSITAPAVMKITLPDGSKVWLNAHTVFKYPVNFTGKIRTVELVEGRAFFDIKHQAAHPFLVKTQSLNITVLGTSFDVRTYRKEGTTKVSVITGKVGITRPGHAGEPAVLLLPKQQVVLNQVSSQLKKEIASEPVVNLWCKSPLVFDQDNLDDVFKAIEKQYNTHIEVDNKKLLNERISITLGNQRLDTIMEILSFTKHFKYQIANDSTVVIK